MSLLEYHDAFWNFSNVDNPEGLTLAEQFQVIIFSALVGVSCFFGTWFFSAAQRGPRWYFFNGPRTAPRKRFSGLPGEAHTLEPFERSPQSPVAKPTGVFSFADKVDWCSRTASFVHSAVCVVALTRAFGALRWLDASGSAIQYARTDHIDVRALHWSIAYSAGYFLQDFFVTLTGRMQYWPLFLVHHIAGMIPMLTALWGPRCGRYAYIVGGFFFVELTTYTLDFVYWIETLKLDQPSKTATTGRALEIEVSRAQFFKFVHSLSTHISFWLWIVTRIFLPIYLTGFGLTRIIGAGGTDPLPSKWECGIPALSGGVGIVVFCLIIFFAGLLPAYRQRLRGN